MKTIRRILPALLAVIALLANTAPTARAARGIPGSPEFGIGARIHLIPATLPAASELAGGLGLDWIAIDLPWAAYYPTPDAAPDWTAFDQAVSSAAEAGSAVMVSLSDPPAWARGKNGPDASASAALISMLSKRHPVSIQSIELFPAPNTKKGWGALPDPAAYSAFFQGVRQKLASEQINLLLVAGGLEYSPNPISAEDQNPLDFLKGLYAASSNAAFPVIGLRLTGLQGEPSDPPDEQHQRPVFRQYENLRALMTSSGHQADQIWITSLTFAAPMSSEQQASWLVAAHNQARSQLYIGTVFLESLDANPDAASDGAEWALLDTSGANQPVENALRELIAQNSPAADKAIPGRAKSDTLRKAR